MLAFFVGQDLDEAVDSRLAGGVRREAAARDIAGERAENDNRPDADRTIAELKGMLRLVPVRDAGAWTAPVIGTSATAASGLTDLADALDRHRDWYTNSPRREQRERAQAVARVLAAVRELVTERLGDPALAPEFDATVDALVAKKLHTTAAAERLLRRISKDCRRDELKPVKKAASAREHGSSRP